MAEKRPLTESEVHALDTREPLIEEKLRVILMRRCDCCRGYGDFLIYPADEDPHLIKCENCEGKGFFEETRRCVQYRVENQGGEDAKV